MFLFRLDVHLGADLIFEHHSQPLLSPGRFIARMLRFLLIGALVDVLLVLVGAIGFRATEGLTWLDAFLDASMVVTGNGPRHEVYGRAAKLFLTLYAPMGATLFVVVVALVLAPALHRLLHVFHVRAPEDP